MTNPVINLQELRRKIYTKAKAEKSKRFWGLYVHVCKMETLREAYALARANGGASGIDGVTFKAIKEQGVEAFLEQIRQELVDKTYQPDRNRRKEISKGNGKVRVLGIPNIRDRVVQGALKLILESIFEADFQEGSYGYRPKRTAHEAIRRVTDAVVRNHTRVLDLDLKSYFDTVRHDILLRKVAERVDDDDIMHLLKLILKASGRRGVPQGGPISPLLSNLYLNEVDKMLERAKEWTRQEGRYTHLEYARFADDIVVLIDGHWSWWKLPQDVHRRLLEELTKLDLEINKEKTRWVDLTKGESFGFLGFDIRRMKTRQGKWGAKVTPKQKARKGLVGKLKDVFRRSKSQPLRRVIEDINPILRGWVNYFRVGHSSGCFDFVRNWVEMKVRRNLQRASGRKGVGWKRWSREWMYGCGLYHDYHVLYYQVPKAVQLRLAT